MVRYLFEEVEVKRQESADAFQRARLVRQNTEALEDRLKEEEVTHKKLRQEATRAALEAEQQRESSLTEIQVLQGRLNHLESEAYQVEVIENYRNGTLRNVEVALAYKAGFNSLKMLLPVELKIDPARFRYPPRVANCLSTLQEIERRGRGLVLDVENGDEDDDDSAQGTDDGSTNDSWASPPEEEGDEEVGYEPQSPPPLNSIVAALPDSSSAPTSSALACS